MSEISGRLIAAAPDMHAEIVRLRRDKEALVEAAQAYIHYCEPNLTGEPILMRIRENFRAILRSATETKGEQ